MPKRKRSPTVEQRAKKHKGASAQAKQIATLGRQVELLKEHERDESIQANWFCGYSSRTNAYPLVVPLTSGPAQGTTSITARTNNIPFDSVNWTKWGSFPGGVVNNQKQNLKLYSQYVDFMIEPGGELDLLAHTVFVVQLKNDAGQARQTYQRTVGMTALQSNVDYCSNPGRDGAQAWINPQLYRIHKRYEFHTSGNTNEPISGDSGIIMQNNSGGMNRHGFKVSYGGRHIKATGRSEEVGAVIYDELPPEYKYFMLVFSDNSIADLENPLCSVSSTITSRMF